MESTEQADAEQRNRSVVYVAATRASDELVLITR